MTFSFNPSISSVLPLIAADDNTFVVSWKDAAEIQLGTPNEALVIPNKVGEEVAGLASLNSTSFLSFRRNTEFSSRTSRRVTIWPARKFTAVANFGNHFLIKDEIILFYEFQLIGKIIFEEAGVTRINDVYFAHHLANNDFNVLIIDLHPL